MSKKYLAHGLSIFVICCLLGLYAAQPKIIQRLDLAVYDLLLPLRKQENISPVPVIIDIDESSLKSYGQWPWPRYLLADLLAKTVEYGATAVGVDVLLAEEDRSSPIRMQNDLAKAAGLNIQFGGLPEEFADYDALLAAELMDMPVVLGAYAYFGGGAEHKKDKKLDTVTMPAPPGLIVRADPNSPAFEAYIPEASDAVLPLPSFQAGAPIGFINMGADLDGLVRQVSLGIKFKQGLYPSLSLRTLMVAVGAQNIIVRTGLDGLESFSVGPYAIPVTPQGEMYVAFQGPRHTYPYYSAKDILQGRLEIDALKGRIVFLGSSAPGLRDIRATPLDRNYPGVEVHAAMLDAMLSGNFIQVPAWTPGMQVLLIVVCGLVSGLAFGFSRPFVYVPLGVGFMLVSVLGARYFFMQGFFVSPLYTILTIGGQGIVIVFLRFWQEELQKNFLRNTFSRYVSPEIVKRIVRVQGDILSGEERELSIMFTDIRSFTSLSEKLSPQQVVRLLNSYFTPMTALVYERSGTLDKFIGDALMAFWNAPLETPGHPALAVGTALAMHERLAELNKKLKVEFNLELSIGVGIHSGNAYVGNMGTEELINYTVIGDAVNIAARLESLCPKYGVGIIVSQETTLQCGDAFAFQRIDTLVVKGRQEPVVIYTPLYNDEWGARKTELVAWENAHRLYELERFKDSLAVLQMLCLNFPSVKLYSIFEEQAKKKLSGI